MCVVADSCLIAV